MIATIMMMMKIVRLPSRMTSRSFRCSAKAFKLVCILTVINLPTSEGYNFRETNLPCPGPADKGPCNRSLYKWAYDAEKQGCVMFIWGGCGGNDKNRFDSELICLRSCTGKKLSTSEKYTTTALPLEDRGSRLTFLETGRQNTFMFAQSNTFIQIDGDVIQTFQLRLCRQISFRFRTRLPHGLLVYHNVKVPSGIPLHPYALYIIVQQGQLKVVHVYGKHSTALTVGRGLNRDEWHSVTVRIDVHGARLTAIVDDLKEEMDLQGLHKENNYGVSSNLTSVVLIGGLSSEERLHGVKYIIESFVGCIKDVVLSAGKSASDMLPITPLVATKHENVQEGCINKCDTYENLCFQGSRCVNHYNTLTCDCFGTNYEGEFCDIYTATVLTLRGSSYVSYRVYDWKDRVHSAINRLSMMFKTNFDDSALFYASGGEQGIDHYIAASIYNNSLYINMDFGDGPLNAILGQNANLREWNNLTIFHEYDQVHLSLNDEKVTLNITGNTLLYIDPEIYIGGGPELQKRIGLLSGNNFAGCIKYVFYNDISIIYELKKMNPKVHYIGILRPEFYEADVDVIPITYPFSSSYIWWPNNQTDQLTLAFDYKSSSNLSVLASSEAKTGFYWEIRVVNDEVRFELADSNKNSTHLISVKKTRGIWHSLELIYEHGNVTLKLDNREKQERLSELKFSVGDKVKLGSGSRNNAGLVGCMRNIVVNSARIDPRFILQTERVVGEVTIDDCQFVDPCRRPNTCEHNGKCSVKEDRLICDCTGTGYIGKNCHFAKYRKTCEELALLGYTKPDVYLIDIDGNGRFPPAHVRCEFQSLEDSTKTIVEHNLPSQIDVRSPSEKDFSFTIKYREFTPDMLQELVSHSLNCSQYIKYDCFKAPLDLHSSTWFISSANLTIDYIGNVKRGTCPCSLNRSCEDPSQWCNCDAEDDKWNSDDGYYIAGNSLGITQMIFLQQPDLPEDALGRVTLGPLECVETNTQRYVVTFTTSQSYIEVPGWRKGDLAFSFRTTGKKAILLYQPPIRPKYPSFMVALTSDYQLTFNFTLNTGVAKELVIVSNRRLNGGEWHKLWIDYNKYHVRFMINEDYQMVDLKPEEEFGPFEGSMFIGGAPYDLLHPKSSVHQGLIGCFRGLVVNEEILDIYSYMSVHLSEIIKDCKPSCVPNPCQNGAQCKELWSTFECICPNPWAYTGKFCENNINTNALMFTQSESYVKRNYLATDESEEKEALKNIFQGQLLLNLRTYDQRALILYANDHLNNFVQIHIDNGIEVIYLFNYGNEIFNISVDHPDLNTSRSVQLAVERYENYTTLHVNEKNKTIPIGVLLLEEYSSKPWANPENEVLAPQRPPAPPTEYFQINIGGFEPESLIKISDYSPVLPGYIGCMRGLSVGEVLIDLPSKAKNIKSGVIEHCNMKCDEMPCKNQGLCIEDFQKQDHTCNCEHTSYYGEFCSDEKGADFSGESILWREYVLNGSVDHVKIQLAFSSMDNRQKNTVLLLLQTENSRSYYLLVGLSPEGFLIVQEDREGAVFSTTIQNKSFINGARHSVYYRRDHNVSELLVDKEEIPMDQIPAQTFTNVPEMGANEVQIGGHNTTDPRFAIYKGYSGCLSNIFIEVNEHVMKPLEEYMLFTKTGAEKVNVSNSHGVRSAQCSSNFDIPHKIPEETFFLNISQGKDKTWVEDAPQRILYKARYKTTSVQEDKTGNIIVIALSVFFVVVMICVSYELYRTDKNYRRRKELETDAAILWHKEQATKLQEQAADVKAPPASKPVQNGKVVNEVPSEEKANGNGVQIQIPKDQDFTVNEPLPLITPTKVKEKRISFRDSASELEWDTPEERPVLCTMIEDEEEEDDEEEEEEKSSTDKNDNDDVKNELQQQPLVIHIKDSSPPSSPNATPLPFKMEELGPSEQMTCTSYA
ncbi:contactin-associated protein like 5-1 [Agrilus planipennis]|uniref:Contactin-associated protein like 5-1 n=1 Tax=Agrilus planipennis TaxID=224129 RepID=A0A1W4WFK2_AGRPL|nr:contactin-associated protein like 5-1 [Agrilus planipennis]